VKEIRLYELLEVEPCADAGTLKKKYRELARRYHPDRNPDSEDLFKDISLAYATLTDPEKRNVYDIKGEKGLKKPCCKAPAYPDKKASSLKKTSSSFRDRADPEMTVSSGDENDDVEASGSQEFERKPNNNKRKLNIGDDNSEGPTTQLKKSKEEGLGLSEHDYFGSGHGHDGHGHDGHGHAGHVHVEHEHSGHDHAGHDHSGHGHAGHDHSGHGQVGHVHSGHGHAGHDHSGHGHAGHDHSGHDHAGHDHSGHGHDGHDHSGHDHAGHDHSGHDHAGHDHSGHAHDEHYDSDEDEESEDDAEEGEGGCPCCPAIGMSPAMMQKLMRMQMEMEMYGARNPGQMAQMYGQMFGPPGSS